MKKIVFLGMILFSLLSLAQENYKVIIIPNKFDFQKKDNQYNLNNLCKLFFEKEGFQVLHEEDLLEDEFFKNRCDYLYLNLNDNSSLFATKIRVDLKDCKKTVLIQSKEVKTKEKDYNKAYNELAREALLDLRGRLEIPNKKNNKEEVVSNKMELKNETVEFNEERVESSNEILISEITKNGYNLLDKDKKVVIELFKTSNPSVFTAKKGTINGILTLNGNTARFESYQNEVLIVEEFQVKF